MNIKEFLRNNLYYLYKIPLKRMKNSWRTRCSASYIAFLRKKGVKIGENCIFREASSTAIDLTRPSLIEIGNHVDMNLNFTILTHDYVTGVFLHKYNEYLPSSGKVKLGNNIYFGKNCTILKGVTIGDNVIIGAHSLVTKDIPSNSVAAGVPAKVLCNIDDYYARRQQECIQEAFEYARSIQDRYHRRPVLEDFFEEFPLFINGNEAHKYSTLPAKKRMGEVYPYWIKNHRAPFPSFEAFLKAAGL